MLRSLFRRRVALFAAVALIVAGPAYALVQFIPGTVWPAAVPITPAAAYFMPVTVSPQLYGDNVAGVEVGRDDRSPFVAIVVRFNGAPTGPGQVPNPIINALGPYLPNFPNFPSVPGYPAGGGTFYYLRFVYRPINDPAHPGWGPPLPGAPGQLDEATETCELVAAEMLGFRAAVQTGAGAAIIPANPAAFGARQLYLEFDPVGPVGLLEFYKFHVIR